MKFKGKSFQSFLVYTGFVLALKIPLRQCCIHTAEMKGFHITSPFYWYHIIVTLLNIFTLFDHGSRQKCKPKPACIGHCLVKTSYSCNTSHYFVCFNASHISHMSHVSHVYDLYSIIHATWHLRVLVKHVFFSLRERFSSHVSFLRLDVSISNLFHHSASSDRTLHAFVCVKNV